jgi:D-alanine-D-alanine ligase
MKIGITYDLREDYLNEGYGEEETAELDKIDTIEGIEAALQRLGHTPERIGNHKALMARLLKRERWDLVFNICEGMFGLAREALVPALLDEYRIPYVFSDAMVLAFTLHKGVTKQVVRDAGVPTAAFAVVESPDDIAAIDLPYPLFAKPVAEGTGKGISADSKVADPGQLERLCRDLLARFNQPVLVETYLPGREFTVGIVGSGRQARCVGGIEVILKGSAEAHAYSYTNKKDYEELVEYRLVTGELAERCFAVALAAWRALGCRDGGRIDLRLDAQGVPNFIEVNPLAGLNPKDSDLPIICRLAGIPYHELIGEIVASAQRRLPA